MYFSGINMPLQACPEVLKCNLSLVKWELMDTKSATYFLSDPLTHTKKGVRSWPVDPFGRIAESSALHMSHLFWYQGGLESTEGLHISGVWVQAADVKEGRRDWKFVLSTGEGRRQEQEWIAWVQTGRGDVGAGSEQFWMLGNFWIHWWLLRKRSQMS